MYIYYLPTVPGSAWLSSAVASGLPDEGGAVELGSERQPGATYVRIQMRREQPLGRDAGALGRKRPNGY
jgi:hypothetical protein